MDRRTCGRGWLSSARSHQKTPVGGLRPYVLHSRGGQTLLRPLCGTHRLKWAPGDRAPSGGHGAVTPRCGRAPWGQGQGRWRRVPWDTGVPSSR